MPYSQPIFVRRQDTCPSLWTAFSTAFSDFCESELEMDEGSELEMDEGSEQLSEWDEENRKTFERLRQDPIYKDFFSFTFPDLEVECKFAEGGQAEIYAGRFTLGMHKNFPCALKIFKKGYRLSIIQETWPHGMLKGGNSVFPGYFSGTSSILGGLLLPDGRFAIVLRREWGDLRQLIDIRMGIKESWTSRSQETEDKLRMHEGLVFSDQCAKKMMLETAMGMQQLHKHGILHRDVKSANVFVSTPYPREFPEDIEDDAFHVKIFDFESSVGVVGTGFWRAPEILQAIREHRQWHGAQLHSTKSDVYAYAMTCYEILTGRIPFEEISFADYDVVISGGRPELPQGIDGWLKELIKQCWHQYTSKRPEFEDIVKVFQANFPNPRILTVQEQIADSKFFWTAKDADFFEGERKERNQETLARLKHDPRYSNFFNYTFHNLEPKLKIAQGGQAEIFEAEFEKENGVKVPCVLKIFDSDFSLFDMIPPGMFKRDLGELSNTPRFGFMGLYPGATRTCEVLGAVVLSNKFGDGFEDRFALVLNREGGDLRRLIDLRKKQHNNEGLPFSFMSATRIIFEIALGMQHLHDNDILHRDLKAANVLVTNVFGEFPTAANDDIMDIKVADFECSMPIVGTNFWRAPEILKQLKLRQKRVFTQKADVYSYGMICYEVLTGGVPLEDRGFEIYDYAAVYERGERPILPDHIDDWLKGLVERCWNLEPSERPEFREIIEELESNCTYLRR